MRFILIAISFFITINSYAEINRKNYLYTNDSKEEKKYKEELMEARNDMRKIALMNFHKGWRIGSIAPSKSEVVYKVGDKEKVDIGAKIGMTKEQILDKTYWGKPDRSNFIIDSYGKLEEWSYDNYGDLIFENGNLIFILS